MLYEVGERVEVVGLGSRHRGWVGEVVAEASEGSVLVFLDCEPPIDPVEFDTGELGPGPAWVPPEMRPGWHIVAGHRNFRELSEPIDSDPEHRRQVDSIKARMVLEERIEEEISANIEAGGYPSVDRIMVFVDEYVAVVK